MYLSCLIQSTRATLSSFVRTYLRIRTLAFSFVAVASSLVALDPVRAVAASYPCYNLTPAQLPGKTLWLTIESGSPPFETSGNFQLKLAVDGTYSVPAGVGVAARSGTWTLDGASEALILRLSGFHQDSIEDLLVLFNGCLDGAPCTSCGYGLTREGVAGLQVGSYKVTDGEAPSSSGLTGVGLLTGGGAFPAGANAFLFPQLSGNPSRYAYKWSKDNVAILGASSAFLPLSSLRPEDSGVYTLEISNGAGKTLLTTSVQVDPPGSPSQYLGRPWVKVVDQSSIIPGASALMGAFGTRQISLHNGVVIARDSNGKSLVRWTPTSSPKIVVAEGTSLPDGNTLQSVIEATAESEGAIDFYARHNNGYAIYEVKDGIITRVTGVGSPVPQSGSQFSGFLWLTRRDGRLVFSASNQENKVGIYSWDGSQWSVLLEPGGELPGLLGRINQALELDLDAQTVVLRANDTVQFQGNNRQGIYRHTTGKGWTEVANVTQPLPGNPGSVYKTFTGVDIVSGSIVYAALPPQGVQLFASDPIGSPRSIGSGFSADLVTSQFSARNPITVYQRYAQSLQSISPILSEQLLGPGHRLEMQVLGEVLDVVSQGTDIAIVARLNDGTTGVYAVVGAPPSTIPIVLGAPSWSSGRLSFVLPTRKGITYRVEFNPGLIASNWSVTQTVLGDGSSMTVTVDTGESAGFCRVVESPAP